MVLLFHIVEWVRQTVLITVILVGVKWLPIYYWMSANFLLFLVAVFWGIAAGFGADSTCKTIQPGRATFLQIQLVTLFVYIFWIFLPGVVCKLGDLMIKPSNDSDGKPLFGSWTHEQFAKEEEEDDDD